jgi:hypothetical protein
MYETYFLRRYLATLHLAHEAKTAKERSLHVRNLQYYRDLIDICGRGRPRRLGK